MRLFALALLLTLHSLDIFAAASPATITSHGIAMHNTLKYPKDFERFDYTSDKATKGGQLRLLGIGTFAVSYTHLTLPTIYSV